jgi:pilus assembly protein CpaE
LPSSPILLLGSEREDRELLATVLQRMGHDVRQYAEPGAALGAAADHHLVVVDMADDLVASAFCRAVRENPDLSNLAILCIAQTDDVEERVRFLEAGTDDVIAKPFDARELEARIEALLLRFRHTPNIAPPPTTAAAPQPVALSSRVVALFSPKGGAGTTTIGVNLALLLRQRTDGADRVAIVDLDLQWGQVATQLNLSPRMSVIELARDATAYEEPDGIKQYGAPHRSGLIVYAASSRPDQAQLVGADQLRRLITALHDRHQILVIDAGSVLDDRTLTILELADSVVIPMTPEIPALRILHALLEVLSETGGILDKTTFLVNHIFAKDQVRLRDIESAVQARVSLELPYDPILYL